jgi:hypothetical protein
MDIELHTWLKRNVEKCLQMGIQNSSECKSTAKVTAIIAAI